MFQGGSLWSGLISGSLTQIQDTRSFAGGQMNKTQFAVKTTGNVSGAVGLMAGVEYGAVLGTTVLPGVGTVIGALAGALVGDSLGRTLGTQAGHILLNNSMIRNVVQKAVPAQGQSGLRENQS